MARAPGADIGGNKVWSDRKAAEQGGKITAINIDKTNFGISRIRTR